MPRTPIRLPLLLAIWTVPALLATIETVVFSRMGPRPLSVWQAWIAQAPGWYTWALLTPGVLWFGSRWRLGRPWRLDAIAMHLGASIACAGVVAIVNACVNQLIRPTRFGLLGATRNWFLSGLPVSVVAYFAILGLGMLLATMLELRERERDAARLAAQLSEAQVQALRMQLQPHFLFNALNAVMALVRDQETGAAVQGLSNLSELLRTTLRDQSPCLPLSQELAFIERYLELERLRLGHRLRVEVDVPDALRDVSVPTFVLQPLVENAIKHGISVRREGGTIVIRARRDGDVLTLAVSNDGPPPVALAGGLEGVGLRNTRERLARMYGAAASSSLAPRPSGDGAVATLTIPVGASQGAP